jgi:hypothetical protein
MFNNTLLEPLTTPGKLLLLAQYGSTARGDDERPQQRLADLFCANFDDPALLTEAFHEAAEARRTIRRVFGSTALPVARGTLGVAGAQLRQRLGRPAGHPGMGEA